MLACSSCVGMLLTLNFQGHTPFQYNVVTSEHVTTLNYLSVAELHLVKTTLQHSMFMNSQIFSVTPAFSINGHHMPA